MGFFKVLIMIEVVRLEEFTGVLSGTFLTIDQNVGDSYLDLRGGVTIDIFVIKYQILKF